MSWNRFILTRARDTASRRKQIYDLDPSPDVSVLLARTDPVLTFPESLRLLVYALFSSPFRRMKLLWRHLTDLDTPRRIQKVENLAQELQPQLSEFSRVVTRFFERRTSGTHKH